MRYLFLLLLFSIFLSNGFSQNYYVAFVKGKVYYQDKLIKKRDKIKMKGNLKFSTADDYVKLSGPGGLFTITPNAENNQSNEFLVAVRQELFPQAMVFSTTAYSILIDENSYFFIQGASQTYFKKNTFLSSPIPVLKPGEEIGFLHETSEGLIYKKAYIENNHLAMRPVDFTLPTVNGKTPTIRKTAIVKVMDPKEWNTLIQNKDSLTQLENLVAIYGYESWEGSTFPAEILDNIGTTRFIKKRKFIKDLRFHLRKCGAPDLETFLEDYSFSSYIWETYGNVFKLEEALKKGLKLPSKYNNVEVLDN